jgi:FdhE protein
MSNSGPAPPVPIGEVANPPFVRLPDPPTLFARRAARLHALAAGHRLAPYFGFLAALAKAQHCAQADLPEPVMPGMEALERARQFAMPPLDRSGVRLGAAFDALLDRLLGLAARIDMPEAARLSVGRVTAADAEAREAMVRSVLADAIPVETLADHVFVAAALQVHFARLAAGLMADRLAPVAIGVCPACGSPPVASLLVGWPGAHGARFCSCALCGTLWNFVRVKCVLCGSTAGITYREVDGGRGIAKAETCDSCRGYVKILDQQRDPEVDGIADDVASLDLDLLVREAGFRRGAVNPFLLGT